MKSREGLIASLVLSALLTPTNAVFAAEPAPRTTTRQPAPVKNEVIHGYLKTIVYRAGAAKNDRLKNPGPHGDPKPLGLTSKPGTRVLSYPKTCSWSQEGNTFVLCDQQYVLGCKLLGGTWTNDGCEGAHEGPGGSHPGPKPGGD